MKRKLMRSGSGRVLFISKTIIELLNVDPEKQSDAFYRYKMPRIMIKVEGNGNGIKTVVCNIVEIAERLARNVECMKHNPVQC